MNAHWKSFCVDQKEAFAAGKFLAAIKATLPEMIPAANSKTDSPKLMIRLQSKTLSLTFSVPWE